ncbi:ABC transporter, partial [Pseudomonas syringae pv. japonica str. M301072]
RNFDQPPLCRQGWRLDRRAAGVQARSLIEQFQVSPNHPNRPIGMLADRISRRA